MGRLASALLAGTKTKDSGSFVCADSSLPNFNCEQLGKPIADTRNKLNEACRKLCRRRRNAMAYYSEDDLNRFPDIGKYRPDLFEKFMAWYQACQEEGALSRREKALIGLAVAHALQCPYCIDSYAQACLESGSNMD